MSAPTRAPSTLRRRHRAAVAVALLLIAPVAGAQTKTSVRASGMSAAYTAVADGVEASRWNPANLGFHDAPRLGIEILSSRAGIANNGIDLGLYNRSMGAHLDDQHKSDILAAIPAGGLDTEATAGASALGVQVGRLALSFGGEASAWSRLPHEVFQLVLLGNAEADSLDFSDADGEAISFASARLSAATTVGPTPVGTVHLGITLRYLRGLAYGRLEQVQGSLITRSDGLRGEAEAQLTTAGAGSGMGFDLGVAAELDHRWRAGLVLENAYARIRFDQDLERRIYVAHADTLDLVTLEETDDPDSLVSSEERVEALDPFDVDLPRVLRLGLARHGESSVLALEYRQGFSQRASSTTTPFFAAGGEWRPLGWLPLRMGLSAGGREGRSASVGVGARIGSFRLDLAAATVGRWWPGNPRGVVLGVGTGLSF